VIPWTVNELALARRLASWGVDGVCTDDVGLLEELTSEP
jgi:glycerophosphoryl diester phosphodiesterase